MSEDARKIEQVESVLNAQDSVIKAETISLALSIEDEEDRDLTLQRIALRLAVNKEWNRAFGVAQFIENGYEKAEALGHIAGKLAVYGHLERALWVFSEAEKETSRIFAAWQQAELLQKLAKALIEIGATSKAKEMLEKAITVAQSGEGSANPQESIDAASVLSESILILASFIETEKAAELAGEIKNEAIREQTLKMLAEHSSHEKLAA